ncbi:S9 family peptidase [Vitiosangium sp. GDMCC 1.1324]|uniref:alpha/beta hydrolase family protein n=1 Tax=Vitiosangium sp. (strain GDMCC 1.1324) TaxID=2138576 RepID=UPI000D34BDE3|nr:alpha/beta fold hydrolase [Vitiosangium sp. GDMCC 1.1324]PTL80263.1 lipase [Vitiosangium sp. GDMCC 1.1324]
MTVSATARPPKAPEGLAAYRPPASMLKGTHGDVIWYRDLDSNSLAGLSSARSNELVVYLSESVHGKPIAVSGIIALPKKAPLDSGYPVISWAHGTVGSADRCAPSRDVEGEQAHPYNAFPHVLLNKFLDQGWAVVMTDYEGLGTEGPHPYLLGKSEARGILDIVRAARQLHPELSDQFAIVGHSQGGQAALFGAHYAPEWTRELTLRGVAALAPASAIGTLVELACQKDEPDGGNAFVALFVTGAIAGDPSIKLEEVLKPESLALYPHVEDRCRVGLSHPKSWGGLTGKQLLRSEESTSRASLFNQFVAMHPNLDIQAPIRISQAIPDKRVNAALTKILSEQLAAKNGRDKVTYKPYLTVSPTHDPEELGYHFGLIDTDSDALTGWLAGLLPKVE